MPQPLRRTCSVQRAVHESRWTRVTSLVAMPSVVVNSVCGVASRSRRMLSHARLPPPSPCVFRYSSRARWQWVLCLIAMRPLCSSAPPVWSRSRTNSHTVVRPPLLRKTTEGPETRPGGWFQRTKGGGRPSQVVFEPVGQILAEIHQPSAPRGPRTLAMVQVRRPTRPSDLEQTPSKKQRVFFEIGD